MFGFLGILDRICFAEWDSQQFVELIVQRKETLRYGMENKSVG